MFVSVSCIVNTMMHLLLALKQTITTVCVCLYLNNILKCSQYAPELPPKTPQKVTYKTEAVNRM